MTNQENAAKMVWSNVQNLARIISYNIQMKRNNWTYRIIQKKWICIENTKLYYISNWMQFVWLLVQKEQYNVTLQL